MGFRIISSELILKLLIEFKLGEFGGNPLSNYPFSRALLLEIVMRTGASIILCESYYTSGLST